MGSGYQGLHVRPRIGKPRRRIAAAGAAAVMVVGAGWVAASRGSSRAVSTQANHASDRISVGNEPTTNGDPSTVSSTDATVVSPDTTSIDTTSPDATSVGTTAGTPPAAAAGVPPGVGRAANGAARASPPASRATETTAVGTTTKTTKPAPTPTQPLMVFIPPAAVWTSYSCVASSPGWSLTYSVRFSGGAGWTAPGGGTTSTVHVSLPGTSAPYASINHAEVLDTVNHQTRPVGLSNAIVIHCPASG